MPIEYEEIRRDEHGLLVDEGGTLEGYLYRGREISVSPESYPEGTTGFILIKGKWMRKWGEDDMWLPDGGFHKNLFDAINWIDADIERRRTS